MKIEKSEMAKLTALPNGESFDSIKKGEAWEKFKEIYYAVLERPLTFHEQAWRCFLAGRASAPKGGPAAPTKDMLMAAVKYENGPDVYTKLPAESLLVEEQMHAEAYAAMMAAAPTDALPVAVSDDALKMLAVRLGLLVEVKGLHYSALALGESSSGEAVARFGQSVLAQYGVLDSSARQPLGIPAIDDLITKVGKIVESDPEFKDLPVIQQVALFGYAAVRATEAMHNVRAKKHEKR